MDVKTLLRICMINFFRNTHSFKSNLSKRSWPNMQNLGQKSSHNKPPKHLLLWNKNLCRSIRRKFNHQDILLRSLKLDSRHLPIPSSLSRNVKKWRNQIKNQRKKRNFLSRRTSRPLRKNKLLVRLDSYRAKKIRHYRVKRILLLRS